MFQPKPFYTLWRIAEKWAQETQTPIMDVIQELKMEASYGDDGKTPSLIVWPTEFFSAKGELTEATVFRATMRVDSKRTKYLVLS